MRRLAAVAFVVASIACGSTPPTSPSASVTLPSPAVPSGDAVITFNGLTTNGATIASYSEAGFTVTTSVATWAAVTTYGKPAPSLQFTSGGAGEVTISAGALPFYFKSIDVYSSTTPIPYTIRGFRNSALVFTASDTVPNTFGAFKTVPNPSSTEAVDTLRVAVTNTRAGNPMGIDNVVLTSTPTAPNIPQTYTLSGRVIEAGTGEVLKASGVMVTSGPDNGRSAGTDASGNYSIAKLQPGTFTVRASAAGYTDQVKTVTLAADQVLSFELARLPGFTTPPGATTIGFNALATSGAAVSSYVESGFTVSTVSGAWTAVTTYGSPPPFIEFTSPGGVTTMAEVRVTAGGTTFSFYSVDLYSSTTPIPYTITGLRGSSPVFTMKDTVGNTFGAFKAVVNPTPSAVIDTLSIALTNPAAPCCSNPTGLDRIVLTR